MKNNATGGTVYGLGLINVSIDETLRRHESKPNAHEFGEPEMRRWYTEKDVLGLDEERLIPEKSSLTATVRRIKSEIKL